VLVFDRPDPMRAWSRACRADGATIAVVPTMGALHDGHLALVAEARRRADAVIVTIFVNPLQFNQPSDFDAYPRPIDLDLELCRIRGVDAVYAPTAAVMYPAGFDTHVEPGILAERLEGPMRPGHFRGVTTVVTKLIAATAPDLAVFGRKDYQQLAIVRRMVTDLDLGVEVVGVDTVREADGLARSSRNARLGPHARAAAVVLPRALEAVRELHAAGEREVGVLRAAGTAVLATEPLASVEYLEIVDAGDLGAIDRADRDAVVLVAAWFGDVRLIDNLVLAA
jgi:pantoate--beta-alanine ligase